MPTVSLDDAIALLYIERYRDQGQNDPLIDKLREGLSPEARKIAFRDRSSRFGESEVSEDEPVEFET